jgi:hypothetical protein
MKFPRYWAKGHTDRLQRRDPRTGATVGDVSCWGWSDTSVDDARAKGRERAERLAERLQGGQELGRYPYGTGERPLREEVLDTWPGADGRPHAVVTRNAYGCRVLNTARAMFVDVDLPLAQGAGCGFLLQRLMGRQVPSPRDQAETVALRPLRELVARDSSVGVRIYRTRAGLRYLFTHKPMDPTAAGTIRVLEALDADPLYVRLCKAQECFRARLTPKPWRCGSLAMAVVWPWRDDTDAAHARRWLEDYRQRAEGYATCELVERAGSEAMDAEMAQIVDVHDRETRVGVGLQLA